MKENSTFLNKLNSDRSLSEVKYYTIAGSGCVIPLSVSDAAQGVQGSVDTDGIVETDHVSLMFAKNMVIK